MENNNGVAIQEPAQAVTVVQEPQSTDVSVFGNTKGFEHAQRVAKMLSESDLVPVTFQKKVGNCVIALEMANRIGASPLMVMQNLYIVHGKPGWSSQFLIATLNASGKFTPLRYEDDPKKDGGATRAYATDKSTKEVCYGAWVSMKMAEAEGWSNKTGSKWKTMPEVMMRYRAAAFFTRQFAPEVSMGILTSEEIQDIPFEEIKEEQLQQVVREPEQEQKETKRNRLLKLIQNAKTLEDLNKHRKAAGEQELLQEFSDKEDELTPKE